MTGRDAVAEDLAAHEVAICGARPARSTGGGAPSSRPKISAQIERLAEPARGLAEQHDGQPALGDARAPRRGRCLR